MMDIKRSLELVAIYLCLLQVSRSTAFECPTVRNQLLIADPEDCRNYYHCLPGGRVYLQSCPKGLVFDQKAKVCVWDSFLSCLKPHQKRELEENTIVTPKAKKQKAPAVKPKKKNVKKPQRGQQKHKNKPKNTPKKQKKAPKRPVKKRRRPVKTTRRTTPTTTTTTTTTTQKPTTTTEPRYHFPDLQNDLIYEANSVLGDYLDMAFDADELPNVNITEEGNETYIEIGNLDEEHFHSGDDAKPFAGNQYDEQDMQSSAVENAPSTYDSYSSFLFFPNHQIVKRAPGSKPAAYAYKVACPNAFAYVVEPGNCDTFYHCNNWKPFVKRCPPGLYFDATNYVCNWPHNVNCYEGKRTDTYFIFNQMRSEKFSQHVEKPPRIVPKETQKDYVPKEEYKINPTTRRSTTRKVTTMRRRPTTEASTVPSSPSTTTVKASTTSLKPETSPATQSKSQQFTEIVFTDRIRETKRGSSIFDFKPTDLSSPTKFPNTREPTTFGKPSFRTTNLNKYVKNNNKQKNLYLFGKSPYSKPWTVDIHSSVEPSVRPTVLSGFKYTKSATDDNHRMNPFTRPSLGRYETLRSKNVPSKKIIKETSNIERPSIVLFDNSHVGDTKYDTTKPKPGQGMYGRVKKTTTNTNKMRASTPSTPAATFKTSTVDYTASTGGPDNSTSEFLASTANDTTTNETTNVTDKPTSENTFEASSTDLPTSTSRSVQYRREMLSNKMKIRKALADLEPSKYAAQNLTRVNETSTEGPTTGTVKETTTTKSFKATGSPFKTSTSDDATSTTDDKVTSKDTESTKASTDNKDTDSTKSAKTNFYTTTVTMVIDNTNGTNTVSSLNNTLNVSETDMKTVNETVVVDNSTHVTNSSMEFNKTLNVNVTSFRANIEDLIDTYHARLDGISFKSADTEDGDVKDDKKNVGDDGDKDLHNYSFNAGADNDTVDQSTDSSLVSFTARTNTDRSAMMVQNQQEVKEVEIDKFMVKMINSGYQPKPAQTRRDLTPNDNMVDSNINDTPAEGDERDPKKRAEKWVLYGNSDNREDTRKKNRSDSRYQNTEAGEDTSNNEAVIEEDIITKNSEKSLIEDNSISGYTDGESSGDIDSYRNAIMIDNTESETKLLEYLSTEEDNEKNNNKNRNYFDDPIPSKREMSMDSSDEDMPNALAHYETTPKSENTTDATTTAATAAVIKGSTEPASETDNTEAPLSEASTKAVEDKSSNETQEINKEDVSSNITGNENKTSSYMALQINDEVADMKINDTSFQNSNSTVYEKSNSTVYQIIKEDVKQPETTVQVNVTAVDEIEEATANSHEESSNATSSHEINEASNSSTNVTTINSSEELNSSSEEDDDQSSTVSITDVKSTRDSSKGTEGKKSFISLSDLIKWYLRHWKNYSQWKGGNDSESHTKAS